MSDAIRSHSVVLLFVTVGRSCWTDVNHQFGFSLVRINTVSLNVPVVRSIYWTGDEHLDKLKIRQNNDFLFWTNQAGSEALLTRVVVSLVCWWADEDRSLSKINCYSTKFVNLLLMPELWCFYFSFFHTF